MTTNKVATGSARPVVLPVEAQHAAIRVLREGDRFCTACGMPNVSRFAEDWKTKCNTCFDAKRSAKYCRFCGEEIDAERRRWTRNTFNKECTTCTECSKFGADVHQCGDCLVPHLRHWKCPSASVPPTQ